MPNVLSNYNPTFYAQEGLIALHKALGMAGRVYRGLDDSQSAREYGETITIRVPGSFVAQDAPSTAQDISASSVSMTLNIWKEVKFALTDKELAFTSQRIIDEHVVPATYALADKIDQMLAAEWVNVPWTSPWSAPATVADITTGFRRIMFNNKVDFSNPQRLHAMLDGATEGDLLALSAFTQHQGSGDVGVAAQLRGYLGQRFGFNFFANQNVPTVTSATVADVAGTNTGGAALGAKTMTVTAFSASAALVAGDILQVAGHTQQYTLTAGVTLGASGEGTLTFQGSPFVAGGGLEAAVIATQVVTIVKAAGSGASKYMGLAFHDGAFALGVAKLPDFMDGQGVRATTAIDPDSRLSLRARTWADGNNSKFYVAFDILAGIVTIDGNKACRLTRAV